MRDVLSEVLKQSSPFSVLKVIGSDTETTFISSSECKTLIFRAQLKTPIAEFNGEFGITNLGLLSGLLDFPTYRADGASFNVKRRTIGEREIVEQLEFASGKTKATFRFMAPELVPEISQMTAKPTWDVELAPQKSKVTEFQKLAGLYKEVNSSFVPYVDGSDLIFRLGNQSSSTHSAALVFQDDITGTLSGELNYRFGLFFDVMKLVGAYPAKMFLKSKTGPMKISIDTPIAEYDYIIRASR